MERRPEEARATTTPTAVEGRREGTTVGHGMSSLGSSLPRRKGVSPPCAGRYTWGRRAERVVLAGVGPCVLCLCGAGFSGVGESLQSLSASRCRCVDSHRSGSSRCSTSPIGGADDRRSSRSPSWRSVGQPAGGPEQRREAPADRSGAERGLAPRPRSRAVRGTGGTDNERRCGDEAVCLFPGPLTHPVWATSGGSSSSSIGASARFVRAGWRA